MDCKKLEVKIRLNLQRSSKSILPKNHLDMERWDCFPIFCIDQISERTLGGKFAHSKWLRSFKNDSKVPRSKKGDNCLNPMIFYFKFDNVLCFYYYFMQEGHRNTQNQNCVQADSNSDHVFLLKRISDAPVKFGIRVDFSPVSHNPTSHDSQPCWLPAVPVFNRDCRHYTPSFVLKEDQAKFDLNAHVCLASHQRKMKEFQEEKEQIFLPKPSPANHFCMVCKEPFDDYLTHVNMPSHAASLRQSQFYDDVLGLCQKQSRSAPLQPKKPIKKSRKSKCKNLPGSNKKGRKGYQKASDSSSTGIQSGQSQENALLLHPQ